MFLFRPPGVGRATTRPGPMTQSQPAALTRTLDAARRKLLETGTRNRLIHVNRDNQRAIRRMMRAEPGAGRAGIRHLQAAFFFHALDKIRRRAIQFAQNHPDVILHVAGLGRRQPGGDLVAVEAQGIRSR